MVMMFVEIVKLNDYCKGFKNIKLEVFTSITTLDDGGFVILN